MLEAAETRLPGGVSELRRRYCLIILGFVAYLHCPLFHHGPTLESNGRRRG